MMYFFHALAFFGIISCSNTTAPATQDLPGGKTNEPQTEVVGPLHFKGALVGGLKRDSIFFDVSANRKKLENLTFKGYWRCSGKLEQLRAVGPEGSFDIVNGVAKGHISDPPDGGSTAWRFDIDATIKGATATGTFRMNINNLGCDTYLLKFTAVQK